MDGAQGAFRAVDGWDTVGFRDSASLETNCRNCPDHAHNVSLSNNNGSDKSKLAAIPVDYHRGLFLRRLGSLSF